MVGHQAGNSFCTVNSWGFLGSPSSMIFRRWVTRNDLLLTHNFLVRLRTTAVDLTNAVASAAKRLRSDQANR